MIRLRLTGAEHEVEEMAQKITKHFTVISQTKSYKNRGSSFFRKYMEIEDNTERNKNYE